MVRSFPQPTSSPLSFLSAAVIVCNPPQLPPSKKRYGSRRRRTADASAKRPRLFIKEMVLCNFKSYAGEQRIVPFHKELIHNSSNHQNLESARVSVEFQEIIDLDDETYEAVKGSDFSITWVVFRDNSFKYYINDHGSNFTDVMKNLKGKEVDLDNNRFLILLGEVEQISLMKPNTLGPHDEGFLEYLVDIIGTNQYVEKIEEACKHC